MEMGASQTPPVMKNTHLAALIAVLALVVIIEESRIAKLRNALAAVTSSELSNAAAIPQTGTSRSADEIPAPTSPTRTKSRPEMKPGNPRHETESPDESFAKNVRKMWDNPAGKSMMNQGVKMAVAMMYQDLIDGLDLTTEESDYFKNLLGKEMAAQQELGMKMLGATPEEARKLSEELAQRAKENEEEIKKFLNNDEDFKSYKDYKNHLPERQQLDGIRTAMAEKGVPLDKETETKLVDAMYRARTTSSTPDLSGVKGLEAIQAGNMVETFEKNWEKQQEILLQETGSFLNEAQMAAFQEHQKQLKEMQLMGIKMAEQMMSGKSKDRN